MEAASKQQKKNIRLTYLKVILINVNHAEVSGVSGDMYHKRLTTHSHAA